MSLLARIAAFIVIGLFAASSNAHHSTAAYDLTRDVVIEGVVQAYQWTNPHCWLKVQMVDESKAATVWNIEFGTPSTSIRMGWSPTTFKPGDSAKFVFHPRLDGEPSGVLVMAVLADGSTLAGTTRPAGPLPGIDPAR